MFKQRQYAIILLGVILAGFFCLIVLGATLFVMNQGRAGSVPTDIPNPITDATISLDPDSGYSGTLVHVNGLNWQPGEVVFIRLQNAAGEMDENYAYAGAVVDEKGAFASSFTFPYDQRWLSDDFVEVVARAEASGIQSSARFDVEPPIEVMVQPTATPSTPTPAPQVPGTISGVVRDQQTGQAISGAVVKVGDQTVQTNANGQYTITNVPPGSYSVQVQSPEHDTASSPVVSVESGQTQQVDVPLLPSGQTPANIDPMARNQVDPNGAYSAQDAIRLAREQNMQGEVQSTTETTLQGDYMVNYMLNGKLYSTQAQLNHDAWEIVTIDGRYWYVVKVCGNLALPPMLYPPPAPPLPHHHRHPPSSPTGKGSTSATGVCTGSPSSCATMSRSISTGAMVLPRPIYQRIISPSAGHASSTSTGETTASMRASMTACGSGSTTN